MPVPEHAVHYLEIVTPDIQAACRLYAASHGWKFQDPVAELGGARVAPLPGGGRCGIRAPLHPEERPTVRTYVRVADIQAASEQAAQLGGELALAPTELPGHGTIAIYLHGGIEQGLWQIP